MNLKLEEVLWEITPECNKNCNYCGSKSITSNKFCQQFFDLALDELCKYPPETVVLTGGEPGISPIDFKKIIQTLERSGVKEVKVVSNGKILDQPVDVLDMFHTIGISINSKEDYYTVKNKNGIEYSVMITNFGKHNIWDFEELHIISKKFSSWQIQLTQGQEQLNTQGIEFFYQKMKTVNDVSYILADNAQYYHECNAAINSCGITWNNFVVPCLSMRSWMTEKEFNKECAPNNLATHSLQEIWENNFKSRRFQCEGKCCRDCIEYPEFDKIENIPSTVSLPKSSDTGSVEFKPVKTIHRKPNVILYGVTIPKPNELFPELEIPDVSVYSVNQPKTFVYGVFNTKKKYSAKDFYTGTSTKSDEVQSDDS